MVKAASSRNTEKSPQALKTISEAADLLDVPQHVLRFWETKFTQVKPLKRNGGRRFYRPEDIEVLEQIKHLLYKQGYTIKGAKKAFEKKSLAEIRAQFSEIGLGQGRIQDNDNQQPHSAPQSDIPDLFSALQMLPDADDAAEALKAERAAELKSELNELSRLLRKRNFSE